MHFRFVFWVTSSHRASCCWWWCCHFHYCCWLRENNCGESNDNKGEYFVTSHTQDEFCDVFFAALFTDRSVRRWSSVRTSCPASLLRWTSPSSLLTSSTGSWSVFGSTIRTSRSSMDTSRTGYALCSCAEQMVVVEASIHLCLTSL